MSTTTATTITGDVYIGLDIGTQSTKAILYHPKSSQVLCRASIPYDLAPNPNNIPGRAEQDPNVWIDAVEQCLKSLSSQYDLTGGTTEGGLKVKGLGVSGQQHGMVPLTSTFKPIRNAKLWCDVEASEEAKIFSSQATELMKQKWDIPPGFTAPKVLWLKQNEPNNYDMMRWCVLPHDYVNLMLRGGDEDGTNLIPNTDAGDASGTGIFDPKTRQYVPALAKLVGEEYYNSLPQILESNAISGHLSAKWKVRTNIDPDNIYPIPISVGSGDNMMSALGTTCVKPGMAVLSLGTSGTIFGISNDPVQTGTPVAPFCDATGQHLPLVCIMSCTGVLQTVLDTWCDDGLSHEEATELAFKVKPGCEGLTFLPYLGGERTPNWPHAKGALLGLTPSNMDQLRSNRAGIMYRAAMEGITYLLADAMETIKTACGEGFRPTSLLVVGGGSKNKLWRQMIADVLQLELRFPLEAESAALGAAFQAGAAAEHRKVEEYVMEQNIDMEDCIVRPTEDEETLELYKDGMCQYLESSRKLFG